MPVLTEATYPLARFQKSEDALFERLQSGRFVLAFRLVAHLAALHRLLRFEICHGHWRTPRSFAWPKFMKIIPSCTWTPLLESTETWADADRADAPSIGRRTTGTNPQRLRLCSSEQQNLRCVRPVAIEMIGRSERIRTSGPCVPNTVLYQAELHSGQGGAYSPGGALRQGAPTVARPRSVRRGEGEPAAVTPPERRPAPRTGRASRGW